MGACLELQINGVSLLRHTLQSSLGKQAAELAYQVKAQDPFPELQEYNLAVQVSLLISQLGAGCRASGCQTGIGV